MSFHAGKMWLFYLKFEVNMVFSWIGSSTFPLVSSFLDFCFLLNSDDSALDNDEDKKDEQDEYSVDEDDHGDEQMKIAMTSKEIMHHHKRNKKETIIPLEKKSRARDTTFLKNELLLPPAEELSPIIGDIIAENLATQTTYTQSKSLEGILIQMHKK